MRKLRSKKEIKEIKRELKGKTIRELKSLILELTPIKNAKKEYILKRDNYKCRICGNKENLQVHRITPRIMGGRNNEENLITLCKSCHMFLHCNPMLITNKSNLVKLAVRKKNGRTLSYKGKKWGRKEISTQLKNKIKNYVLAHPNKSIRQIAKELNISKSVVHKYMPRRDNKDVII